AFCDRLIMPRAKALIPPPVHSVWLVWKWVGDAEIVSAQKLSYLLSLKDQTESETNLPGSIGQVVAMPTSPGVVAWTKQLQHASTASAYKQRSCSTEVPRYPDNGKRLAIESD